MVQFLVILGIIVLTVIAYVMVRRSHKTQDCCAISPAENEAPTWNWEPVTATVEKTPVVEAPVVEAPVEEAPAPKAKKAAKAKPAPKTKAAKAKPAAKSSAKTEVAKRGRKPKNGGDSLLLS